MLKILPASQPYVRPRTSVFFRGLQQFFNKTRMHLNVNADRAWEIPISARWNLGGTGRHRGWQGGQVSHISHSWRFRAKNQSDVDMWWFLSKNIKKLTRNKAGIYTVPEKKGQKSEGCVVTGQRKDIHYFWHTVPGLSIFVKLSF